MQRKITCSLVWIPFCILLCKMLFANYLMYIICIFLVDNGNTNLNFELWTIELLNFNYIDKDNMWIIFVNVWYLETYRISFIQEMGQLVFNIT